MSIYMNCNLARKHIDRWHIEASLLEHPQIEPHNFAVGEPLPQETIEHIQECQLCEQYAQNHILNLQLTSIAQVKAPSGLAERVISNAQEQNSRQKTKQDQIWRKPLLKYGFVAVFIVSLSFVFINSQLPKQPGSIDYADILSNIELQVGEVKNTQVQLTLQQAISQASMRVKLPTHIEIDGYQDVRLLNWQTNLKSGKNVMVLPLQLLEPINGLIAIEVEHQGVTKSFTINVNVVEQVDDEDKTI